MCFSASRKGLEGLSLSSVRETVEEIRGPKYVYPSTIYQWSEILILVFLELITDIQKPLKEYNVSTRQFSKPTLDRDKIIRSSAYKREFNGTIWKNDGI